MNLKNQGVKLKNEKPQFLLDKKPNGRVSPWREKKKNSLKLADAYERIGQDSKAQRVRFCGEDLFFRANSDTGALTLERACFCRERLCPMCSWRRSLKVFSRLSKILDVALLNNPRLVPVFLTLTVRNCKDYELNDTINMMYKGWKRLINTTRFKAVSEGWFRAMEITRNKKADTYHPHFHSIILVDKKYFSVKSKTYIPQAEWCAMWGKACALDYTPICDIRRVRSRLAEAGEAGEAGALAPYKAVAEVAKYAAKDTDYIGGSDTADIDFQVALYSQALKGRRLCAFGGLLKSIAKDLDIDNIEGGDLVHIDDDKIRTDIADTILHYGWRIGFGNFVLLSKTKASYKKLAE